MANINRDRDKLKVYRTRFLGHTFTLRGLT